MSDAWSGIQQVVRRLHLAPEKIIAPAGLRLGIPFDTDQARAVAAIDAAEVLVLSRTELGQVPGDVVARFALQAEPVFMDDSFVVLRKRKASKPAGASWLEKGLSARLQQTATPMELNRSLSGVYVDPRTVLATTWWGDMIYLVSVDASITPHILRQGRWEHWIEDPFRRVLRSGMNVVDIGCNIGYYALAACRAVGPTGHVTAIDANPEMTRLVQMSLACNGYAPFSHVITAAVMRDAGEVILSVPRNMLGGGSTIFAAGGDDAEKMRVPGAPLDQLLARPYPIDLIKIDAEGAEPLIYAGGKSVINGNPDIVLFMEFSATMIQATRPPQEFLDEIRSDGFLIYELRPGEGPVPVEDWELVDKRWTEVLLIRDGSRVS